MDLDKWLDKVEKILESHNLHNLIKKNIPWPTRDNVNGQKWKTLSKQVRAWLSGSIDSDLLEELNGRGNKMSFADEFVDEIKKHMKGEGHGALKAAMAKFRSISRSQFSTTEEYISGMKKTYKTLVDLKSRLVPYFALETMLMELRDVTELESFIVLKDNELNAVKDPVEEITIVDFHHYCTAILDHIASLNDKTGIISAAVVNQRRQFNNNPNNNTTNNSNSTPPRLTNAPPRGVNAHEHAKRWKAHKPERSNNGNCSYCGTLGHGVQMCWYLHPELRWATWRGRAGIWVYNGGTSNGGTSNGGARNNTPTTNASTTEFKQDRTQQVQGQPTDTIKQANLAAPQSSGFIMTSIDDLSLDFNPSFVVANEHLQQEEQPNKQSKEQLAEQLDQQDNTSMIAIQFAALAPGYPWILDTGASEHICSDQSAFLTVQQYAKGEEYEWLTSGNEKVKAEFHGMVQLSFHIDDISVKTGQKGAIQTTPECHQISIHCVHRAGQYNLFSLGTAERELGIWWNSKSKTLHDENDKIIGFTRDFHRVPFLQLASPALGTAMISTELAHRRLGHAGSYKTKINQTDLGCDIQVGAFDCEACGLGKSKRIVSRTHQARATRAGYMFHVDLQPVSPAGYNPDNGRNDRHHAMVVTDDATRYRLALCLATKGEASSVLQRFAEEVYQKAGQWPAEWRIDGGTEFSIFTGWAKSKLMTVNLSAPYAHEQNGVSEFTGHYLLQIARTMGIDAASPKELWTEALNTACYITNRLRRRNDDAPIIAWRKQLNMRTPDNATLSFLRTWYAKAYVHIPKEKRIQSQKMEARAWIGHLVGYEGDNGHIYRIYNPKTRRVSRHRDVIFWEQKQGIPHYDDRQILIGGDIIDGPNPTTQEIEAGVGSPIIVAQRIPKITRFDNKHDKPVVHDIHNIHEVGSDDDEENAQFTTPKAKEKTAVPGGFMPTPSPTAQSSSVQSPTASSPDPLAMPTPPPKSKTRSSGRQSAPPKRFEDMEWDKKGKALLAIESSALLAIGVVAISPGLKTWQIKIPRNREEALQSPERDLWQQAMDLQVDKLGLAKAYQHVNQPPAGSTILPGKWVFDIKCDKEDVITEFRARWVICGNRQRPGFDFDDTYAPVARPESTRLFLTMVALQQFHWEQIDYTTAYLNALIDERCIFMRSPTGYETPGMVCMINQAMYGLRQSACLWYETIRHQLEELGFQQIPDERCIFMHKKRNIWLLLYVDDTLCAAKSKDDIEWLKKSISFKIKVIGEPARFLGCSLTRSNEGIFIDQGAYVEDLLRTASLGRVNSTYLPMKTSYQPPFSTTNVLPQGKAAFEENDELVSPREKAAFGEDVGKVGWLTMRTRPDIAFAVNRLQRRTANPRKQDLEALSQMLRYLMGTPEYGIQIAKDPNQGLIGYVDASYNDCEDGKSTEAYVFYYAGAPISWSSRKQDVVATGSTVAEYIALDSAVREALYLVKILRQLDLCKDSVIQVPICTDSDNAVAILRNDAYKKSTKWLDVKYHFVKHAWKEKWVDIRLIDSKNNPADALTKALSKVDFERLREYFVVKKSAN